MHGFLLPDLVSLILRLSVSSSQQYVYFLLCATAFCESSNLSPESFPHLFFFVLVTLPFSLTIVLLFSGATVVHDVKTPMRQLAVRAHVK